MIFNQLIKKYILPKEPPFFENLYNQATNCTTIFNKFSLYIEEQKIKDLDNIFILIESAKENRKSKLKELFTTFITPVDKEAINRCYTQLYMIELSIKHLLIEMKTYEKIDFEILKVPFQLLVDVMNKIENSISMIKESKYVTALNATEDIFHLNNQFSYIYAKELNDLYSKDESYYLHVNREILIQFKSILNHQLVLTSDLRDIIFKLN